MAGVWWAVRAEARRRWASWLALAALVALVAGTVLVGAAAARTAHQTPATATSPRATLCLGRLAR